MIVKAAPVQQGTIQRRSVRRQLIHPRRVKSARRTCKRQAASGQLREAAATADLGLLI
ncbi:MAG TPA: hypothetical protein VNC13_01705 [Propionibacteriaceae bacterium]|nr:hypothetical protein [Propionibacteriaceae bacterium]